ncbi:MAG: bifunctional enoyl-CoA hydratase/phosphate acetyltransferase [Magnetococcales bacterium]|nr:bifunctional enoyl-CoA hydratase/phosphate acetyltransferase [Magnetococcales bacterium]MBF0155707.1 bifunctional enoyl-CoA hydratase/phosphate acetyltransferase [Magnetococcales bacterium]
MNDANGIVCVPAENLDEYWRYDHLIKACAPLEMVRTAVVHPCDRESILGAVQGAEAALIEPVLVGPRHRIMAAAEAAGVDISGFRLVNARHSHEASSLAVGLARSGDVDALMKGSLHTDEIMSEVVRKNQGLRTERRVSHVFLMDIPDHPRPLIITDAVVNIFPDLMVKRDICQNAIDMAIVMGIEQPRVAVLSAVETINPNIPSTIEAAALAKMADRGQITGALVDGPFAYDNAISVEAARTKKIGGPVAGNADILVVPDLEAGNMLAKQLTYHAKAESAGLVLGARVPIILTSRADTARVRLASCAVAARLVDAQRKDLLKRPRKEED